MFEMFDKLILLDRGRVVYFGPAQEGARYFERLGYGVPPRINPPDHFVDVLLSPDRGPRVNFADMFEASPEFMVIMERVEQSTAEFESLTATKTSAYSVSSFVQYKQVVLRELRETLRNPVAFFLQLVQTLFMAFVVGSIFYQVL